MMCMVTVMFVILVVVCITVPTVILTQNKKQKNLTIVIEDDEEGHKGRPFQQPSRPPPQNGNFGQASSHDEDEYYAFDFGNRTTVNITADARSGSISNIFSSRPMRQGAIEGVSSFVPEDFTLKIEGVDFKCTQLPPLL